MSITSILLILFLFGLAALIAAAWLLNADEDEKWP